MKVTLAELEQTAKSLGVRITYEDLKASRGGSCRVMASRRIIINKHLHLNEKINLLARELGRFDLSGLDLSDGVRKKIRHESDHPQEPLQLST